MNTENLRAILEDLKAPRYITNVLNDTEIEEWLESQGLDIQEYYSSKKYRRKFRSKNPLISEQYKQDFTDKANSKHAVKAREYQEEVQYGNGMNQFLEVNAITKEEFDKIKPWTIEEYAKGCMEFPELHFNFETEMITRVNEPDPYRPFRMWLRASEKLYKAFKDRGQMISIDLIEDVRQFRIETIDDLASFHKITLEEFDPKIPHEFKLTEIILKETEEWKFMGHIAKRKKVIISNDDYQDIKRQLQPLVYWPLDESEPPRFVKEESRCLLRTDNNRNHSLQGMRREDAEKLPHK